LPPESVPDLGTIISAGEPCPWDLAEKWKHGRRFINGYGPTEATVGPTCYEVNGHRENTIYVPIGRPIANMRAYVLDEQLNPVALGVAGELFLGGVGIARGYLNLPELTAEKFIADPFSGTPGGRLYRTGDLVRLLPGGDMEFLGRADQQVKLRGFRIELGEIEAVLRQHSSVQDAAVIAWGPSPTERQLAAFVVPRAGATETPREVREHVKSHLPHFMVPSAVVYLPALPVTPNGKVDRAALARQSMQSGPEHVGAVAPRNEIEAGLFELWKQVLKHDQFGVTDDFFEMGGHSLLAVRLSLGIEQRFGQKLSLGQLLEAPTIEAIARSLPQLTLAATG
jgi:acyl-coenzyme A synthetase/AMP-(fatty) acid ligase